MNKQEAIEQLEYSIGRITEFGRALNVVPLEKAKYWLMCQSRSDSNFSI